MTEHKPPKSSNPLIEQMVSARNDLEAHLQENPDYRALVALDRAIAELGGTVVPGTGPNGAARPAPQMRRESAQVEIGKLTQPEAADVLLTQVLREPVPVGALVKALGAHGIVVGGETPNINLSSVLSKDGRFRSVRFRDRKCWWVKNRPFPGELDSP